MTEEEYMQQIIADYNKLDDDPDVEDDFFDYMNVMEEYDELYEWEQCLSYTGEDE